jgi:hypothetical protein
MAWLRSPIDREEEVRHELMPDFRQSMRRGGADEAAMKVAAACSGA